MLSTEYTKEEFEALIPEIDTATADNLYSYFSLRTPVDNFAAYAHQTALTYADQYARLLRDESVEYDAMVTDYIERLTKGKTTEDLSKTTTGSGSKTDTTTTKNGGDDVTVTDTTGNTVETPETVITEDSSSSTNGSRKNTGTQDTSGTGSENTTGKSQNGDVGLLKTNPMQITYSVFRVSSDGSAATQTSHAIGMPDKLDWSSADSQQQTFHSDESDGTKSTTDSQTRTDNLTETTSDSGTGKVTTTNSGKNTTDTTGKQTVTRTLGATVDTTTTGSDNSNQVENGSNTSTSRTTDRYTGRHGYSPAELLQKSRDYILLMKSFRWLCEKFNHCFVWTVEL